MLKRFSFLLVILVLLVSVSAWAENAAGSGEWVCPVCGSLNTDRFCPKDGTPRTDEWTCPVCGSLNTDKFCPKDGTPKPEYSSGAAGVLPSLSDLYPGSNVVLRSLKDPDARVYSHAGPGNDYLPSGGYKPANQRKITAYFIENGWVYCYVQYATAEDRCVCLRESAFDSLGSELPRTDALTGYEAVTKEETTPVWGPSDSFHSLASVSLEAGMQVQAFFEENGYIYAEFVSGKDRMRMWLPAGSLSFPGLEAEISDPEVPDASDENANIPDAPARFGTEAGTVNASETPTVSDPEAAEESTPTATIGSFDW